jgi:multiple sugar transport system substrate-binding protein
MIRRLALAIVVLALASAPALPAGHSYAAATTRITWWSFNDPAWVAANKAIVKAFEKANPSIQVDLQPYPYAILINKLITAYASHTQPDVAQMFGTWVTSYAKAGKLDPVPASVMSTAQINKTFWSPSLGAYQYQGQYYGLPHEYNLENGGLLINTQLWKQAGLKAYPHTWAELTADAKKLTKYDSHGNITRAGIGTLDPGDDSVFMPLSMVLQQGGTYFAKDNVHFDMTSAPMIKAMTAYTDWYVKDKVASYTLDQNPNSFGQGRIAMAFDGPWSISTIKTSFPKMQFAYVPFPSFTSSPPYFAAESGWGEVVSKDSKNKDADWTFFRFLSTQPIDRLWNMTTASVPSRRDLFNDPQYLAALPGVKTSFNVLKYGRWIGDLQNRDDFFGNMDKCVYSIELHRASISSAMSNCESIENKMVEQYVNNF